MSPGGQVGGRTAAWSGLAGWARGVFQMSSHRMAALIAFALSAAACASSPLHQARKLDVRGSIFDKALHANYVALSASEWRQGDHKDSDAYAARAIAAGSAMPSEPEPLESGKLPADKLAELAEARERLLAAFANGARERSPVQAARAQVMFECWMQEQEENGQPQDLVDCRQGFVTAMDEIAPPDATVGAEELTVDLWSNAVHVEGINFDSDSAKLREDALPALRNLLSVLHGNPDLTLRIEGHTDSAGPESYNLRLSQRRAQAVVDWLIENGIDAARLQARGIGETEPVADNDTMVGRAANRRIDLTTWTN